ncbi:hypothetical protein Nepgr_023861 [Nepenthes gracilis]|uniref:Uncharacterized protein n=1 Tax=Nepenthes gracilis TaxID=150966 RepID=A0AAD3XY83_NEPGR|nr:hypothetical protein Nepgr_023861 [Nepenthes gracilis]
MQISLREQLSYFKEVVKTLKQQFSDLLAKRLLTKAVYLFSMGGNDYFSFYSSYPSASQSSQKRFVVTVLGNLTQVLEVFLMDIAVFMAVQPNCGGRSRGTIEVCNNPENLCGSTVTPEACNCSWPS